jgi:hypothetical protein
LRGEALDEEFVCSIKEINSKLALVILNLTEAIINYIFDGNLYALNNLSYLTRNEKELQGFFTKAFGLMWLSLFHYERYLVTGKRVHKRFGRKFHRKVNYWATSGTHTLHGPNRLLDAMAQLCKSKVSKTENLILCFQSAANDCAAGQCRLLEALAYERLAKVLYALDPRNCCHRIHSDRAVELYRDWGAIAKADHLERIFKEN